MSSESGVMASFSNVAETEAQRLEDLVQKLLKRKHSSEPESELDVAEEGDLAIQPGKKRKCNEKNATNFLDLPAELHAMICHFLFADTTLIVKPVPPTPSGPSYRLRLEPANSTALLRTCSGIHDRAKDALKRKSNILQIVSDFNYWNYPSLKDRVSLAMPSEWKNCIKTITYTGKHAQELINLIQFPNLERIRVETKMIHFSPRDKPAGAGVSTMILNKARKQHKPLAKHTRMWTQRCDRVKVVSNIWLLNKKALHCQGWVAELEWTNMQIVSITEASFTKQEEGRLDKKLQSQPAAHALSPLPRYWRRIWKQGLEAWQVEIDEQN